MAIAGDACECGRQDVHHDLALNEAEVGRACHHDRLPADIEVETDVVGSQDGDVVETPRWLGAYTYGLVAVVRYALTIEGQHEVVAIDHPPAVTRPIA